MGRKLRDKLPQVQPARDQATEAEWQVLLRERYAQRKLREKEYADPKRHATTSDIAEGDLILLRQNRENKLSPMFEPENHIELNHIELWRRMEMQLSLRIPLARAK